jgi:hypothetical protein
MTKIIPKPLETLDVEVGVSQKEFITFSNGK